MKLDIRMGSYFSKHKKVVDSITKIKQNRFNDTKLENYFLKSWKIIKNYCIILGKTLISLMYKVLII